MGIGKRSEKILLWWEISLSGRKKVFRCMDHLVLRHPSYMRGFTYPFSLSVPKGQHQAVSTFHQSSNGKSSIVEERLYSFFFAFLPQKNEVSFFSFFSSTQLLTKTFVLLRSCKILKSFTSFCFDFTNFWNYRSLMDYSICRQ